MRPMPEPLSRLASYFSVSELDAVRVLGLRCLGIGFYARLAILCALPFALSRQYRFSAPSRASHCAAVRTSS